MRFFKLIRIASLADGMFGVLLDDNIPFCVTLERPWKDNQRNISCIPKGSYVCLRWDSPKFGETFQVTNVKDRSYILFHSGNIDEDSHGCILLAEMFEPLWGEDAILNPYPGKAMKEFMSRLKGSNGFALKIEEVF